MGINFTKMIQTSSILMSKLSSFDFMLTIGRVLKQKL